MLENKNTGTQGAQVTPEASQAGKELVGHRATVQVACENCGTLFMARQSKKNPPRFCSDRCRVNAWKAAHPDWRRRKRTQIEANAEVQPDAESGSDDTSPDVLHKTPHADTVQQGGPSQ